MQVVHSSIVAYAVPPVTPLLRSTSRGDQRRDLLPAATLLSNRPAPPSSSPSLPFASRLTNRQGTGAAAAGPPHQLTFSSSPFSTAIRFLKPIQVTLNAGSSPLPPTSSFRAMWHPSSA
ncbi:hypothetical protein ACP70R_040174 [Stipagrostis hirtigluma subsp. patula]